MGGSGGGRGKFLEKVSENALFCAHLTDQTLREAEKFVETYLRKLPEGNVTGVIGGIRQMVTKGRLSKHRRAKVEQCLNYFAERCEYMKYDEYLAAGYPIGSGIYLNDDWNTFHADRIQAEQSTLYPHKECLPDLLDCAA